MGRMLEALGRSTPRPDPPVERVIAMVPKTSEPVPVKGADSEPVPEEQLPFIEVGGPRSVVDASADVLATAPATPATSPLPEVARPETTGDDQADDALMAGTIAIWCSWTLRPGIRRAT